MPPIRIAKHLESDTLHLPELRPLIGRDVEITVREQSVPSSRRPVRFEELLGPKSDPQLWEGFDETLDQWRSEPYQERID